MNASDHSKYRTGPFSKFDAADIRALIEAYPLAWVLVPGSDGMAASQLPLIGEYDDEGRLVALIGHLGRANPLAGQLAASGRATILFDGPNGYVSPEHAGRRDWAPTWNHAHVKIAAEVEIDPALTEMSLDVLTDAMERDRADPWHSGEISHRYQGMLQAIIGFRATVTAIEGRFKLGQDERPDTLHAVLASQGNAELVRWMRRFNEGR
ncbi:FMN-binding negative transcriptional regulator [Sphingomonas sp. HF-S4]|uniref:FMN-binding negative transcriptional regulator n=1 Tax=Sphingomonas agrestis TaxID=3080540 RepID=A0ABU3Y4Q9_9SPHN|nr:FMN-binding negative transcriptional regulator [Sphingomonas sp. HF-S4]MDV3456173.1 FMN-binding negative transcriptional regulator [Sphingomonas sp. HF-S4]